MKITIENRKKMAAGRIVSAGQRSNMLSPKKSAPVLTTKPYSTETKVYSPISRGI